MTHNDTPARAALASLICLQGVMLLALFAKSPPHPPADIPLFAMGPFLATSLSSAIAALIIGPSKGKSGKLLSLGSLLFALVSYGPHKYFDPAFGAIWPAVICAQIAALTLGYNLFQATRRLA